MKILAKPIIAFDQHGSQYIDRIWKFDQAFYHRAKTMVGTPISLSGAFQLICEEMQRLMDQDHYITAAQLWQGDWLDYLKKEGFKVIINDNEWDFVEEHMAA